MPPLSAIGSLLSQRCRKGKVSVLTRTLKCPAQVQAPDVRPDQPVGSVEFRNEIPGFINKLVRARGHICRTIPGGDDLLSPPASVVISKIQFLLGSAWHRAQRLHTDQTILSVPREGPPTVVGHVAVGVVTVALGGRGHKHVSSVGAATGRGHRYILP